MLDGALCESPGHALEQSREVVLLSVLDVELSDLLLGQHQLSLESHREACLVDVRQDLFCAYKSYIITHRPASVIESSLPSLTKKEAYLHEGRIFCSSLAFTTGTQ